MPSTISWIDHDSAARERSLRILQLFQERDTRDELGLGAIRDSIADQLFPGTSTIQTRLRYMFFVPWLYQRLEEKRVPVSRFAALADAGERDLIPVLLQAKDKRGAFGRVAGRRVKRLPSSVYWYGLGAWGIRLTPLSQEEYHRRIGQIYRRRDLFGIAQRTQRENEEDASPAPPETTTWHQRLPQCPDPFPNGLDFLLTEEEAQFLLDLIQRSCPQSLLAHLTLHGRPTQVRFPWEHPDYAGFLPAHKELLEHARLFCELMHGAAIVYNVKLAQLRNNQEWIASNEALLEEWLEKLPEKALREWQLDHFWTLTSGHGHGITHRTQSFIRQWREIALEAPARILASPQAHSLIEERERVLKGPRSRFKNPRALEQWGGSSGLTYLSYRWPNTEVLLNDLFAGLGRS